MFWLVNSWIKLKFYRKKSIPIAAGIVIYQVTASIQSSATQFLCSVQEILSFRKPNRKSVTFIFIDPLKTFILFQGTVINTSIIAAIILLSFSSSKKVTFTSHCLSFQNKDDSLPFQKPKSLRIKNRWCLTITCECSQSLSIFSWFLFFLFCAKMTSIHCCTW